MSLQLSDKSKDSSLHEERVSSDKSQSSKTEGSNLSSNESFEQSEINPLAEVLEFDYSYGYDCKQHFNLCVIDENVLIFYSGTLIHIFYSKTSTFEFRRSYSGSGIGHIVKNPRESHLAVGEKGSNPFIIVYEWPTFNIVSKLQGGTAHAYSHLGYSPDGTMLVSQGKEPDHTITIWDWKREQIILRVKSHGQDVFNAEFSQFVPGQLTTSGLGHIKFWKMANTFTGLKLQGELGRFGKTEICDILGICAMPDEKVISGCEWGNLLAWEDRLIKLEVRQKAKGNCHKSGISQIHFNSETQDIISVGMDGWVKLWTRATIDAADPPDEEDWCLEMQPSFELQVKDYFSNAKLMSIYKKNSDPQNVDWYAQDADGGIWAVKLHADSDPPERLMTCHAGSVADMAASPVGTFLATLGTNGCLLVHDTLKKQLVLSKRFKAAGNSLIWMPTYVEATGAVLVGGFGDGVLRMFVLTLRDQRRSRLTISSSSKKPSELVNIIQRVKAHNAAVTVLCLNPRGSILVSGSEDNTLFVHQILPKREYIVLVPIGFVELTAPITFITWTPKQNATAVVACVNGSLSEVRLPEKARSLTSATYNLSLDKRELVFKSVKSELLRADEVREIERKKEVKLQRKKVELEKVKANNPNLDIDEELFLMDSDDEIEFPPLYYPDTPSPVMFVMLLPNGNLMLSMGDYDCGYLYQYAFGTPGPISSTPVPGALNTPLHCFLPICNSQLMAFGMANGVIRLVRCENGVPDLSCFYDLPMHDPENGKVRRLCTNFNGTSLYSCGTDGNVFTYKLNLDQFSFKEDEKESLRESSKSIRRTLSSISATIPTEIVSDAPGEDEPSLEDMKKNAERLHQKKLADERKNAVRKILQQLMEDFNDIVERNNMLPISQVLPHSVFELDPRITEALQDKVEADKALMMRKIAYKVARSHMLVQKMQNHFVDDIASLDVTVRAIKNEDLRVKAFTLNKLTHEFLQHEFEMKSRLDKGSFISTVTYDVSSRGTSSIVTMPRQSVIESMQKIQPFYHKLTLKARKALMKRNALKAKKDHRERVWREFLDMKPDINTDDPVDLVAFQVALETIGDFKLKSSDTYKVPEDKRVTPAQKYWQMLCLQREVFESKEAFNKKVCLVRDKKISLVRKFKQMYHDLDLIQRELSPDMRKERLKIPTCYLKNNFPEHIFRLEFGQDPTIYQPVSGPHDEEKEVLQVRSNAPVSTDVSKLAIMRWQHDFSYEWLQSIANNDKQDTPWELELKVLRMIRRLYEQDMIIKEMQDGVRKFDDTLEPLSIDRLKYARDVKLMEIFRLTLYQELIVINGYADQEDKMLHRINSCTAIRNEKARQKVTIQDAIDTKNQDIALWQMKLTEMQEEMASKLTNNKFANFLNRVYKKKRVVKHSEDSESESSSSDDETEEEFEDDDNEDYVPIKLDENTCPEGCDPNLFEEVTQMRNLRYEIEDTIAELRKQVDDHQRELTVCNKDLNRLESDVQKTLEESEALQFEKQQKLNNIETVVVLNLSQFCHFVTANRPEDGLVTNPLVFHSEVLVTLAGRVRELQRETEAEQLKIEQQKMLMQRLNKRRKEMMEIRKCLLTEIKDEVLQKFGEWIEVEEMEEAVLKKMINQARRDFQVDKLREKYDKIIKNSKVQLWHHTKGMIDVEKENTRRLKLQTMLEQEAMKLNELIRRQNISKDKVISVTEFSEFEEDIKRLESVLECQEEVNFYMKEEIKKLSYKCTPPEVRVCREVRVKGAVQGTEEPASAAEEDTPLSQEFIITIDKVLSGIASGSSAYDVAASIVEDLLRFSGDEERKTSALDCALRLVEELLQITTGEDSGDVLMVEQYTDQLLAISKPTENTIEEEV